VSIKSKLSLLRYCVKYAGFLLFVIFCISQGSVTTRLRCGGKYNNSLNVDFLLSPAVKKKLKIDQHLGQHLPQLYKRIGLYFWIHGVYSRQVLLPKRLGYKHMQDYQLAQNATAQLLIYCRAMLCKRGLCRHAVSVCLSRSWIPSKWVIVSSDFFHSRVAKPF